MERQPGMGGSFHRLFLLIRQPFSCHLQMKLLKTQHQAAFRAAEEFEYPGVGYIRQAGHGAGDFTLYKIREAGHSEYCDL